MKFHLYLYYREQKKQIGEKTTFIAYSYKKVIAFRRLSCSQKLTVVLSLNHDVTPADSVHIIMYFLLKRDPHFLMHQIVLHELTGQNIFCNIVFNIILKRNVENIFKSFEKFNWISKIYIENWNAICWCDVIGNGIDSIQQSLFV